MISDIRELDEAELNGVGGAMTKCDLLVYRIYATTAIALEGLGDQHGANLFKGLATGSLWGGSCHGY
jgi:hypothetical protein